MEQTVIWDAALMLMWRHCHEKFNRGHVHAPERATSWWRDGWKFLHMARQLSFRDVCKYRAEYQEWNYNQRIFHFELHCENPYWHGFIHRKWVHIHGHLPRYVKIWVAHAPGMLGTFSPPPRVSDPDMHHGTYVTHVPWCIPGSLTSGLLWSRWQGKRSRHSRRMCNPRFCVSRKRSMV